MKQSWEDYDKAAERGPMALILKVLAAAITLSMVLSVVGYGLGWFGEFWQGVVLGIGATALAYMLNIIAWRPNRH